jgi:hypothetical protein
MPLLAPVTTATRPVSSGMVRKVLKTLAAPIYLRLLITADPVDEATADQAVRVTLAAAHAGALRLARDGEPATG